MRDTAKPPCPTNKAGQPQHVFHARTRLGRKVWVCACGETKRRPR